MSGGVFFKFPVNLSEANQDAVVATVEHLARSENNTPNRSANGLRAAILHKLAELQVAFGADHPRQVSIDLAALALLLVAACKDLEPRVKS